MVTRSVYWLGVYTCAVASQAKYYSMTPTSASAWSTKQSPLQVQSREIIYHCSAGLQCERNQEHNYSCRHSRMTVLCSPGCTLRRKYGVVISTSSFNMKTKRIHLRITNGETADVMVCQCKCIERHMQSKRSVWEDDETRGRSLLSLSPRVIVIK